MVGGRVLGLMIALCACFEWLLRFYLFGSWGDKVISLALLSSSLSALMAF